MHGQRSMNRLEHWKWKGFLASGGSHTFLTAHFWPSLVPTQEVQVTFLPDSSLHGPEITCDGSNRQHSHWAIFSTGANCSADPLISKELYQITEHWQPNSAIHPLVGLPVVPHKPYPLSRGTLRFNPFRFANWLVMGCWNLLQCQRTLHSESQDLIFDRRDPAAPEHSPKAGYTISLSKFHGLSHPPSKRDLLF